jgi:hypothetical protein
LAGHLTASHIIPNNVKPERANAKIARVFNAGRSFSTFVLTGSIDARIDIVSRVFYSLLDNAQHIVFGFGPDSTIKLDTVFFK